MPTIDAARILYLQSQISRFNDKLALWGANRIMDQQCGQTWLQTFSKINGIYSSGNQLNALQLVTWNDYEEGTEIESGIDNCVSVAATLSKNTLDWPVRFRCDPWVGHSSENIPATVQFFDSERDHGSWTVGSYP